MRKFLLSASLAIAMNLFAQNRGNLHIAGEVEHDPSTNVGELSVELHDQQQHQMIERVAVMNDGSFEFRHIATGNYEVRLVNRYNDAIRSEYVNLAQGSESIVFRLDQLAKKSASGAVTASELGHHVNKKALREYRLAARAATGGDPAAAIPHLTKAIEADPDFVGAHHQLGVALSAQGAPEQAVAAFQKAISLDPALVLGHLNLAIVLMQLKRFNEAEPEARRAIQLEPGLVKAHYVLALSLLRQRKFGKEALNHLRWAYEEYPQARAIGARLETQLAANN